MLIKQEYSDKITGSGKLNYSEVSRAIGLDPDSIKNYLEGKTKPNYNACLKLVKNTRVNIHWLLTGEGGMLKQNASSRGNGNSESILTTEEKELLALFNAASPEAKAMVIAALKSAPGGALRKKKAG